MTIYLEDGFKVDPFMTSSDLEDGRAKIAATFEKATSFENRGRYQIGDVRCVAGLYWEVWNVCRFRWKKDEIGWRLSKYKAANQ